MKMKAHRTHNGWEAKVISAGERTLCWGSVASEIEDALGAKFNIDNYEVVNVTERALILKDKDNERSFIIFETFVRNHSGGYRQSVATEWKQIKEFEEHGCVFLQYHDIFMGLRKMSRDEDVVIVDMETMTQQVIPLIKWEEKVSNFEDIFEQVIGSIVGDDDSDSPCWKRRAVRRFAWTIMHSETDWDALDW